MGNVESFLFRQQYGKFALDFIAGAYHNGIVAFAGTPVHQHLLWLLRLVVHRGHDDSPGIAPHLATIAEGFTECQAVQARTVERVGLEVLGVRTDFRGVLIRYIGEYKGMAVKMLAA